MKFVLKLRIYAKGKFYWAIPLMLFEKRWNECGHRAVVIDALRWVYSLRPIAIPLMLFEKNGQLVRKKIATNARINVEFVLLRCAGYTPCAQ